MDPPPLPDAAQITRARAALVAADPALAELDAATPPFAWRTRLPGFAGLVRAIVGQQVSVASADAVWARFEAALGGAVTPETLLALDDAAYREAGFSGQKTKYAKGIAEATAAKRLDFDRLSRAPYDEALAELVALKGIGAWTGEVFLMMAQGRLDAFPAGDIAVQEAMRWLDRMNARPTPDAAYARAAVWRPYRGVAAHMLWEWYVDVKNGTRPHPMPATPAGAA